MGAVDKLNDRLHTWENLWAAYQGAARGKRGRAPVADFEFKLAGQEYNFQPDIRNALKARCKARMV